MGSWVHQTEASSSSICDSLVQPYTSPVVNILGSVGDRGTQS